MTVAFMHEVLARRRCCPMVVERVLRLNPTGFDRGSIPRGWHRHLNPAPMMGLWGKGRFIRRFGRAAWEALPACTISRRGKRAYVDREAVEDSLWMLPAGNEMRRWKRRGRKFWTEFVDESGKAVGIATANQT